ncbi:DEAD/DEAH box helicase [Agrilactobacillus fermenti]|uniref:DEAD/DEAH box helicase n=1 Tax=Agrilactobacillus fermenti TaxID=2586909 RepID=UPI001E5022C3|nr:DEAD/DEAH box helicase [Agrilactobacillus fermenti]
MNETIAQVWARAGFKQPTPIQAATYEPLLQKQNILGLAPTGTGKTLAFSLPILERLTPGDGGQVIILVSSQELAHQIRGALAPFVQALGLKQTVLTGNANVKRQLEHLKQKPEVLIATVGRLMELLNKGKVKAKHLQTVIFDEADALMVDNGREKLQMVVDHLPKTLQFAFFGATTSDDVTAFAAQNRVTLTKIDVRQQAEAESQVKHLFLQTSEKGKAVVLKELSRHKHFYGIVFFRQKNQLIKVSHILNDWHVPTLVLDGRKDSMTRKNALQDFRKHQVKLLLTTDMAARGLDIDNLTHVINFDIPEDKATYIHRSGRTGRMGKKGTVLNLGNAHDQRQLQQLIAADMPLTRVYLVQGQLQNQPQSTADAPATTTVEQPDHSKSHATGHKKQAFAKQPRPNKPANKRNKHRAKKSKDKGRPKWA